jgi:hypothetical protein
MFSRLARPFVPTSFHGRDAGRYLQFNPWLDVTSNGTTRETDLDDIRWHLFLLLIAEITGSYETNVMARSVCSPTESLTTVKQRVARLAGHPGRFDASARRANGIVAVYRTRFGPRNKLFDELIDAPIWQLAKKCSWELVDLAELSKSIELMGFNIDDQCLDCTTATDQFSYQGNRCRRRFGRKSQWAWLNADFFRMMRAEAVGDIESYGVAFDSMQRHLRYASMLAGFKSRDRNPIEANFLYHFGIIFSAFLSGWQSRVRVICKSNVDIAREVNNLSKRELFPYGYYISQNGIERSIAGRPFFGQPKFDGLDRQTRLLRLSGRI